MSGADPKALIAASGRAGAATGEVVNLGIGIPNLIPDYLGSETEIFLHTENGLLGVGPRPTEDELDPTSSTPRSSRSPRSSVRPTSTARRASR